MAKKTCEHKELFLGGHAPFDIDDTTDYWEIECANEDCGKVLAEGDRWTEPPIELLKRVIE